MIEYAVSKETTVGRNKMRLVVSPFFKSYVDAKMYAIEHGFTDREYNMLDGYSITEHECVDVDAIYK